MKKKGFTLIELLVVIAIIAMLLAILMPALSKVKKIAQRVVCGTNLKGLGTAQTVYAHDYNDQYTVQGRGKTGLTWGDGTVAFTQGWQNPLLNWNTQATNITVGASLYLLVREADVSPKSFVCPGSDQVEFSGKNDNNIDLVELWDFGHYNMAGLEGPAKCVSYSYHQPYGTNGGKSRYAADGTRSASFAVMADRNPYFDPKITIQVGTATGNNWIDGVNRMGLYYVTASGISKSAWEVKVANSKPHDRDGQNVLFADGHASYENTSDVGIMNDGIYLPRGGGGSAEDMRRAGFQGTMTAPGLNLTIQPGMVNGQNGTEDSYLVNDSKGGFQP